MKTAYIYVLKCPTTLEVRYVGKTDDLKARLRQHICEARRGIRSHKCMWIRKLVSQGLKPVIELDTEVAADTDWKAVEIERVAFYKAAGARLTNGTNGGDEPGELTDEGRKILSERAKEIFASPEGRKRSSDTMRELCKCPDYIRKRSETSKKTRSTPEYRKQQSERTKAMWLDPVFRAKQLENRKRLNADPEFRKKLSGGISSGKKTPEARAKASAQMKAFWADPENKQKRVEATKKGVSKKKEAKA